MGHNPSTRGQRWPYTCWVQRAFRGRMRWEGGMGRGTATEALDYVIAQLRTAPDDVWQIRSKQHGRRHVQKVTWSLGPVIEVVVLKPRVGKAEASEFWKSVGELAAMRKHIPEERRALSSVRHMFKPGGSK